MQNILIVDDEKSIISSIRSGMQKHYPDFNVLTAENGKAASAVLESTSVDLVVTDLRMPEMDGFELLAYMSTNFPSIPAIVMSGYGTTDVKKRLKTMGSLGFIDKPVDFDELGQAIIDGLEEAPTGGSLKGISISNFLQLIEMEQKTCLLEVQPEDKGEKGFFYFNKGSIYDAVCGDVKGKKAALEIISWDNAMITFKTLPKKMISKRIKEELMGLMMEAMRLKDESIKKGGQNDQLDSNAKSSNKPFRETALREAKQEKTVDKIEEVKEMTIESALNGVKGIKGYLAAGIMNFTGETLVSDSVDSGIDPAVLGATFNDIFRSAHEACEKIGLEACREAVIITPKGIVVMACSGVESKAHFHVIGVLSAEGNQALMKMEIEKMIPPVMDELA